ncbi:helix-turn-helix transcriptional regulator [Ectopseudomonas chengduensis]
MIGERLKEERKRLGLTQPGLAEIAGAAKRTVIDWEKGVSSPTAAQLEALSRVGMDVLFVVTGTRGQAVTNESNSATSRYLTENADPVTNERGDDGPPLVDQAPTAGQIPAMPVLTRRERYLLANYRGSDEEGRRAMEATASALAHRDSAKKNGQDGE